MGGVVSDADILDRDFRSFEAFIDWFRANPAMADDARTDAIRVATLAEGLVEPLTGRVFAGHEIAWDAGNYRETGLAGGLISRHRAVLHALESCAGYLEKYATKIYGAEALTEFALRLRERFPKYLGSEYTAEPAVRDWLYPVPVEDLTRLSLPTGVFDIVTTNEVLEHVPSIDDSLRELARVLRPGGWHVGTAPFAYGQHASIVKTRLIDGEVVHLTEPEWHRDPIGDKGSLVFELPGWDILERALRAGFSDAFWKLVQSRRHGIASNGCGGVFVLCLKR